MAYDHLTREQLERRCQQAEQRLRQYEHVHGQLAETGSVFEEPWRWQMVAPDERPSVTRPKPPR